MKSSRPLLRLGIFLLVGSGIMLLAGLYGLWQMGYLDSVPPRAVQSPILYPNSQNVLITRVTDNQKLVYPSLSFDTADAPISVTTFYRQALEGDGWGGDSDTGGPEELHIQRCYNPSCHEMYLFDLLTQPTANGGQPMIHVMVTIELIPYPP